MILADLVPIGKLGSFIDEEGFIRFRGNANFQSFFFDLRDIFLVFKDNRVRYVTIDEIDTSHRVRLRIKETEVVQDAAAEGGVMVMLPRTDTSSILEEHGIIDYSGMQVFFEGKKLGNVSYSFDNSAQDILVIKLAEDKEVMIPIVDYYVEKIETEKRIIYVTNIEGLMEL